MASPIEQKAYVIVLSSENKIPKASYRAIDKSLKPFKARKFVDVGQLKISKENRFRHAQIYEFLNIAGAQKWYKEIFLKNKNKLYTKEPLFVSILEGIPGKRVADSREKKGYILTIIYEIKDTAIFAEYAKAVRPIYKQVKANSIARNPNKIKPKIGESVVRQVLVEFDSIKQAKLFYSSDAYQKANALIEKTVKRNVLILPVSD